MNSSTLLIACDDKKGLVAKITGALFQRELNIVSNSEFVEHDTRRFFMRTEVEGDFAEEALLEELKSLLPAGAEVRLAPKECKRIVVLATREPHCLGDLLIRCGFNETNAEIVAVVSNHDILRELVEKFGHPYHYVPHAGLSRDEHEAEVLRILDGYEFDYIVMAKYMRILNPGFVNRFPYRIVNIHHSFLPAFIGANPYKQAFDRGVKIIGATAHFATESLDEGPIIEQHVNAIGHHNSPRDITRAGHNIEKTVLARALDKVLDDRVFVSGNKTIIFD